MMRPLSLVPVETSMNDPVPGGAAAAESSSPIDVPLALVGGGKMGRALIQGMIAAGMIESDRVTVAEINEPSRRWWQENVPAVRTTADSREAVQTAEIVILAVKPDGLSEVAASDRTVWPQRLTISVAAGVSLAKLQALFASARVVRVMPNTPSLVGEGASAFCCAADVTDEDAATVQRILQSLGFVARVSESQMDAVTGLSGSGPAYIFVIIEALADGGVSAGLPRPLALQLATQTVLGAAKMVMETGEHPAVLKDAVASPGGTTIAGLSSLEQNGVRRAMIQAVQEAARRSREMGAQ